MHLLIYLLFLSMYSPKISSYSTRFIMPSINRFRVFSSAVPFSLMCFAAVQRQISSKSYATCENTKPTTLSSLSPSLPPPAAPVALRKPMYSSTVFPGEALLPYQKDRYGGVIVDPLHYPENELEFRSMLDASLKYWKYLERRGIWLKIPIEKSQFIPIAVQQGFYFHHAEKEYLMLCNWLSEEENRIPPNASHQVGVGNVVIKDGKMLMVQERNGPLRNTGIWKMPTGLVDAGEDLSEAAVREVFEETGVKTEFDHMLCFRQSHGALFGKSDLFFVCILRPLSYDIQIQESEIAKCDWIDPEVYFAQDFFKQSQLYDKINQEIRDYIRNSCNRGENILDRTPDDLKKITMMRLPIGFRPGMNSLYFVDKENSESRTGSKE